MAFDDDIQEAAYTSPSGKRQTFIYENVSRETDLKTATFVFPEMDGAFVQSLGFGARSFPLKCIFTGAKCKREADSFEKLLEERGHGILEHPIYGKINAVPTGKIKRVDNLVDGVNEASVEVTFSQTITDTDFPTSEVATVDDLDAAMDAYTDSAAADFADKIQTESIEDKMQLQEVLKKQTDSLFKGTEELAKKDAVQKKSLLQWLKEAKSFVNGVINDIDKIGLYANEIARTVILTARTPCRIAASALSKIAGYSKMISDIANNVKADPFGANAVANQFAATQIAWGGMVAALSFGVAKTAQEKSGNSNNGNNANSDYGDTGDAASAGGFTSRADVLETAAQIAEIFDNYSAYVDSQAKKNAYIDTGDTYEKLLNVVVYSLKTLEEAAFNLPVTRIIVLDRDRQLFELLAELYGKDGFNRQDQFINDNKLTADEIVLLPMGREVRYYV